MYETVALLGGFVLVYSAVAGLVDRSWVSGPMLFTGFGLLIGPMGLDVFSFEADRHTIALLAEFTLALVLFTDAASADLGVLRRTAGLPARLLLIGLPLTIALGYVLARLVNVSLAPIELVLLATMLAPTDAALGKAVITNPAVPAKIRQGLNLESGLNDGICVPILFLFLALVADTGGSSSTAMLAVRLVAGQIGIGLAVGVGLTAAVIGLFRWARRHGWLAEEWMQIPVVALAAACFAIAQLLGGSGFIAAFAGGLLFAAVEKDERELLLGAAEGTGETLALITWVIFGSAVVGQAIGYFNWRIVLYSVLSLTLIRMLPVYVSLAGTKLAGADKLFLGWFGPRGLASIVFAVIVLDEGLPGAGTLAAVVACSVILSIFAHGISANPAAARYRNRAES